MLYYLVRVSRRDKKGKLIKIHLTEFLNNNKKRIDMIVKQNVNEIKMIIIFKEFIFN